MARQDHAAQFAPQPLGHVARPALRAGAADLPQDPRHRDLRHRELREPAEQRLGPAAPGQLSRTSRRSPMRTASRPSAARTARRAAMSTGRARARRDRSSRSTRFPRCRRSGACSSAFASSSSTAPFERGPTWSISEGNPSIWLCAVVTSLGHRGRRAVFRRRRPGRRDGSQARAAARRGRGALRAADHPQCDASSTGPGAAARAGGHRRRAAIASWNCLRSTPPRATCAPPTGRRTPRRRSTPRGCTCCPASSTCTCTPATSPKTPDAEYVYKLWMAHGITAGRGVPFASPAFSESEKARSARNEITAPRMFTYRLPLDEWEASIESPEQAREWVRKAAATGIDGLKLNAYPPEIMAALLDEAKKLGLGSTAHLSQQGVAQMNALDAARLGPRHGHPFLRNLRGPLRRARRAAVAAGPQPHRRAAPVRAGGAAVEPDPPAGQRGVEGAAGGAQGR